MLVRYKRQLNIDRTGEHPLKLIYRVLRYAWNHTCPENRSAFTYWEEDIPPRIDLGEDYKYGGPFTIEEVEDTKTFFRILILLLLSSTWVSSNRIMATLHCWISLRGDSVLTLVLDSTTDRRPNEYHTYLLFAIGVPLLPTGGLSAAAKSMFPTCSN